ncbi:hypothetical protein M378DRAFT_11857 [Amanita muscaria Koide BX008]|uniref:Uncharacterized protein n=1 Tax=Amanita muscaria (strain Koide BX008) TaxID=946122 RepID=A0A0C2X5F5_AMAMK|nr:hypothetical protein M378DRAFT_11857 [Amanita muscaria Koide BX008]
MAFYPPPGSQLHSVYSPLPSVTAYPASHYYPSRRSRRYSTSSFSSYPPLPGNYGLNSYPYWYGQGYSGSTSPNIQMYPMPQVLQTQPPYFGNPYIPSSSYQSYYPMQGSLVDITIVGDLRGIDCQQ